MVAGYNISSPPTQWNPGAYVKAKPDLKNQLLNAFHFPYHLIWAVTTRRLVLCLLQNLKGSTYHLEMVPMHKFQCFTAFNWQKPVKQLNTSHISDWPLINMMVSVLSMYQDADVFYCPVLSHRHIICSVNQRQCSVFHTQQSSNIQKRFNLTKWWQNSGTKGLAI